jgi:hypothetical protein
MMLGVRLSSVASASGHSGRGLRTLLSFDVAVSMLALLVALIGPSVARPWTWALFGASLVGSSLVLTMMVTDTRAENLVSVRVEEGQGQAIIHITRSHERWRDQWRVYKVIIDGRVVGGVANGESKDFALRPGKHQVRIGLDWTGSENVAVEVGAGGFKTLCCEPKGSPGTSGFRIFSRRAWVDLHVPPSDLRV